MPAELSAHEATARALPFASAPETTAAPIYRGER